jgi:hypothetical protein
MHSGIWNTATTTMNTAKCKASGTAAERNCSGYAALSPANSSRWLQVTGSLLTGNRREPDFRATNGELVKVRSVDGDSIRLDDGRTLPANYSQFDHGYAITAHRSQGKTVDGVILSADAMKQELFYVGASRGRSEIAIVTSDREQLRESLCISSAHPSATELTREQIHSRLPEHRIPQTSAQDIESLRPRHEISAGHDLGFGL